MLLYDLIKREGYKIPDCPVFEITNVAQFCEDAKHYDEWQEQDLEKITGSFPPFDIFFMEWDYEIGKDPEKVKIHTASGKGFWKRLKIGQLWYTDKQSNSHWACCQLCFVSWRYTNKRTGEFKDRASLTGKPEMFIFGNPDVHIPAFTDVGPRDDASFFIDKNGSIVPLTLDPLRFSIKESCKGSFVDANGSPVELNVDALSYTLLPSVQALMFMNMHPKSVRVIDKVQNRHERRRAEHEGKSLTKFKVLEIRGMGQGTKGQGNPSDDPDKGYSWHIVRGYRATYCPKNSLGLFGKEIYSCPCHTQGTGFWFSSKYQGRKDIGTVEKIYQVTP